MVLQVNNSPVTNSPYQGNPVGCRVYSVIISLFIHLVILLVIFRQPKTAVRVPAPLIELQRVVLEEPKIAQDNPPKRIQTRPRESQNEDNEPPKEAFTKNTNNISVETTPAPAQESDIPAAPIVSHPGTSSGAGAVSDQPRRIGNTAELDNTDFAPVYNPKPDYPVAAQEAGITGYVDIDLVIDENGKVDSYSIVKVHGHPSFATETAKVLPRWRFPPPRIGGKKVKVKYVYRVNFTLD